MKFLNVLWKDILGTSAVTKGVLLMLVLVFGLTVAHDFTKTTSLDSYIHSYNAFKKDTVAAALQKNDSLLKLVNVQTAAANKEKALADTQRIIAGVNKKKADEALKTVVVYKAQVDSLSKLAPSLHSDSMIIAKQDTIIKGQDTRIAHLTLAYDSSQASNISLRASNNHLILANQLLGVSNDSLTTLLYKLPDAPKNPDKLFNFIPLPTRTSSALGGAAVGSILTILAMTVHIKH